MTLYMGRLALLALLTLLPACASGITPAPSNAQEDPWERTGKEIANK